MWHALHALPPPSNRVNWAGFYVVNPAQKEQLILGPFQGKVSLDDLKHSTVKKKLTHLQRWLVRRSHSAEEYVVQPQPRSRRSSFQTWKNSLGT
jgi:hypothetical protein